MLAARDMGLGVIFDLRFSCEVRPAAAEPGRAPLSRARDTALLALADGRLAARGCDGGARS